MIAATRGGWHSESVRLAVSVVVALAIHAMLLLLRNATAPVHALAPVPLPPPPPQAITFVSLAELAPTPDAGGSPGISSGSHGRATRIRERGDAWKGLSIRTEGGANGGSGGGFGHGIGLGDGGGVERALPVPPPPPPPPPSRARAAHLVFPSRHDDVDDEARLFVAVITVDRDGSVVGVHFKKTHPGSRGERAESAIWTFRYQPALDAGGNPIPSTFEQEFQVR